MDSQSLASLFEKAVYTYSRHIDKCRLVLRRSRQKDGAKVEKAFARLAMVSKRIEELLNLIDSIVSRNNNALDREVDDVTPVVFYIYEVAIEEERELWSAYKNIAMQPYINEIDGHFNRLNKMKETAQRILETLERAAT